MWTHCVLYFECGPSALCSLASCAPSALSSNVKAAVKLFLTLPTPAPTPRLILGSPEHGLCVSVLRCVHTVFLQSVCGRARLPAQCLLPSALRGSRGSFCFCFVFFFSTNKLVSMFDEHNADFHLLFPEKKFRTQPPL